MKTSFFIKSKSTIDRLNTYYNRERNSELALNYFDEIDELYLSSRTLFEMRTKENREGSESPKFGKLFNFEKPVSILPQSYSIYSQADINENEDLNEVNINLEENSERNQRITKMDYIYFFIVKYLVKVQDIGEIDGRKHYCYRLVDFFVIIECPVDFQIFTTNTKHFLKIAEKLNKKLL